MLFKLLIFFSKLIIVNSIVNNNLKYYNYCTNCDKCSFGFTGSGVLLFEKDINNKKNFILGIDYKNELTDFGGKIDNNKEKVFVTASRECNEETKGIINLTHNDIIMSDHIDICRFEHKYRCYLVETKYFDINKFKKIKINNMENNEIISVIKINEDKLKKILDESYLDEIPDIFPYYFSTRLIKILNTYYL